MEDKQSNNFPTTTESMVTYTTAGTTTTTTTVSTVSRPSPYTATSYQPTANTETSIERQAKLSTTDVRVSWIYTLLKPQLIQECQNRNLDPNGRSDDLRARLVAHLRTTTEHSHHYPSELGSSNQQNIDTLPYTGTIPKATRNRPRTGADDLQTVKEIIGLAPDADLRTLTQRLSTLMREEKLLAHETYIHSGPPDTPLDDLNRTLPPNHNSRTRGFPESEVPKQPMYPWNRIENTQAEFRRSNQGYPIIQTVVNNRPESYPRSQEPCNIDLPRHIHEYETRSYLPPSSPISNFADRTTPHEETTRGERYHLPSTANLCDLVRKWNLKFDDKEDPVSFLERLTELLEAYEIPVNRILRALPEIFKGNALLWWRNNHDLWRNYADFFRDFESQFLPPGYYRNLDREIQERTQGEQEPCRAFVVALSTLIRRRGGFQETVRLERIYQNLKPDYKFYIRRNEVKTVCDLVSKAEEYEALLRDKSTYRPPPGPAQAFTPSTAYQSRSRKRVEFSNPIYLDVIHQASSPRIPLPTTSNEAQVISHNTPEINPDRGRNRQRSPSPRTHTPTTNNQQVSQQHVRSGSTSPTPRSPITCWNCEREGHLARECPQPRKVRCFYCKKEGRLTVNCNCRSGNG